jgi:hypothetical protein
VSSDRRNDTCNLVRSNRFSCGSLNSIANTRRYTPFLLFISRDVNINKTCKQQKNVSFYALNRMRFCSHKTTVSIPACSALYQHITYDHHAVRPLLRCGSLYDYNLVQYNTVPPAGQGIFSLIYNYKHRALIAL